MKEDVEREIEIRNYWRDGGQFILLSVRRYHLRLIPVTRYCKHQSCYDWMLSGDYKSRGNVRLVSVSVAEKPMICRMQV